MGSKDKVGKHSNVLPASGLNGIAITGLDIWAQANAFVIEINYSGGPYYIKVRGSQAEYGGTSDWGTGTQLG